MRRQLDEEERLRQELLSIYIYKYIRTKGVRGGETKGHREKETRGTRPKKTQIIR